MFAEIPGPTVGWPNSEHGAMGLEGAVKLGFKRELDAITDVAARNEALERMVEEMQERGGAINVASHFERDDVVDPAGGSSPVSFGHQFSRPN